MRIDVRRAEPIKNNDNVIGHVVKIKVVKNKLAVPYKQGTFDLYYGKGIDIAGEIASLAATSGMLKRGGSWYSYVDTKGHEWKWQGKDNLKIALTENADLFAEFKSQLMQSSVMEDTLSEDNTEE